MLKCFLISRLGLTYFKEKFSLYPIFVIIYFALFLVQIYKRIDIHTTAQIKRIYESVSVVFMFIIIINSEFLIIQRQITLNNLHITLGKEFTVNNCRCKEIITFLNFSCKVSAGYFSVAVCNNIHARTGK